MNQTAKIILGITTAICVTSWALNTLLVVSLDTNDKWGLTASDLQTVATVIRKASLEKQMTPDDWEKVIDTDEFADLVGQGFEDPQIVRADRWGQPLVIEKRKAKDQIAITIRSTYQLSRWRLWEKVKILGIEVTVFRDPEKPLQIKYLWRDD